MDTCVIRMRRERRKRFGLAAVLLASMALLVWWLVDAASDQYRWQWYRVWRYVGTWEDGDFIPGVLLEALGTTLELTALSLMLSLVVGAFFAGMKLSSSPVARLLATSAVGALRNTPLLMQLFMIYFVAAPVLGMGPFMAAVLSLALFEGAYLAEIFRGNGKLLSALVCLWARRHASSSFRRQYALFCPHWQDSLFPLSRIRLS